MPEEVYQKTPTCQDCGIPVTAKTVKRCQPCYHKFRSGPNHPQWKAQRHGCLDCGVRLRSLTRIRCWDCHIKRNPNSGANNGRWQPVRPTCADCGVEVCISNRPKRCRPCHFKYQKFTGSDNPNWKGGVMLVNEREIHSQQLTKWRRGVFSRDRHRCRICGVRGGTYLQAHHIKRWSDYPELRFEIDNGVTLCRDCHLHIVHQGKWANEPLNFWA
jgi:hypothetical protein